MNSDSFCVFHRETIKQTLTLINENKLGFILTVGSDKEVLGLATDGDIRSYLANGGLIEDAISNCANPNFVWADSKTSREIILKNLDHVIKVIPILDKEKRLLEIVTRDHLPIPTEHKVYARSMAPVRVSFGGGGSDLTHYFAEDNQGAVINTTISLYSHATLRLRNDSKITIVSQDLQDTLEADDLPDLLNKTGRFGLIQAVLKVIHPAFGFNLYLHSDFPMNSGLGGSAVVAAAILGCFNQFRTDKWDSHELAELAFQAERLYLNVSGGWQDQYATVFGGFNFMEFRMEQNLVHPLRVSEEVLLELEQSLVLCNTRFDHDSGDIHKDQKESMKNVSVNEKVQSNVELTYKLRNYLLKGNLREFGKAMHDAWLLKRQFSKKISNSALDNIYDSAIANGAIGGKLLGAGGGGFFLFFVPPFEKHRLMQALRGMNLDIVPFRFEHSGLRAWSARDID